ncbi:MAG: hypothetical protein ACQEW0_08595 [Pseudomonadota bacterium]
MTDIARPADGCLDAVRALCQTVEALLDEPASEERLVTAMTHYQTVHDALTEGRPSAATQTALSRVEEFIIVSADAYYQQQPDGVAPSLDESQRMALFGRRLMALEGIGPATAKQLFALGIFTPEQLFGLSEEALETLDLPPASRARVTSVHQAQRMTAPD